jgi:DNA-binding LacI/PurR family transcriptional regulator
MKLFEKIKITADHGTTFAHQLKQQLSWLIAIGELKPNDTLPPIREFAQHLGINMHTVRNAYKKLERDGLVLSERGKGTKVLPFDPTHFANASRIQNSNLIGVILPSLSNPFYHQVLAGIEEISDEDHSILLLSNSHDEDLAAWRSFSAFASRDVEGILVISHDLSEYFGQSSPEKAKYKGIPFVSIDTPYARGFSINLDLHSVGYQAAHHLLQLGHENVGMISFYPQADVIRPILDGFLDAHREMGKMFEEKHMITVRDFSPAAGYEGASSLLQQKDRPSAVFLTADTLAIGALRAFHQKGLKIPENIAIVSFNNIPEAEFTDPSLTSINASGYDLGRKAMNMLKSLIAGEIPSQTKVFLPVEMVIRNSCGGKQKKISPKTRRQNGCLKKESKNCSQSL